MILNPYTIHSIFFEPNDSLTWEYKRMVTLKDIAKATKCSVSTVSMALSDHPNISMKTKKDVLRVSRKLGYKPLRERMRARSSPVIRSGLKRIGFFLIADIHHHEVYPAILNILAANISSLGLRFEMASLDPDKADTACEKVLDFARGVDGLLLSGFLEERLLETLAEHSIPHVVIGRYQQNTADKSMIQTNIVDYDYYAMGKLAVRYLAECGHRRIGFACETMYKGLYYSLWLDGYRLGMWECNLPLDPDLVHVAGRNYAGGEPAAEAFMKLSEPPTAFLLPEARTARSFIHAMEMRGKRIDARNIVIGGNSRIMEKYNVSTYPLLAVSEKHLAMAALRQLIQIFENPLPFTTQLYLPFLVKNIPGREETADE